MNKFGKIFIGIIVIIGIVALIGSSMDNTPLDNFYLEFCDIGEKHGFNHSDPDFVKNTVDLNLSKGDEKVKINIAHLNQSKFEYAWSDLGDVKVINNRTGYYLVDDIGEYYVYYVPENQTSVLIELYGNSVKIEDFVI